MKYFILAILVVMGAVGCTTTMPHATTFKAMDVDGNVLDKEYTVVWAGSSEGTGLTGLSILDGNDEVCGSFAGTTTGKDCRDGAFGVVGAVGNGSLAGYFFGRGVRQQSDNFNVSQNGGGANAGSVAGAIAIADADANNIKINKKPCYRQKRGGGY